MSSSKPEFPSLLFSKNFEMKLFLSLELFSEIVALQHRQSTCDAEPMRLLNKETTDCVLPSS